MSADALNCPKCAHPAHPRLNCEECFDSGIVAGPCVKLSWRLHENRKSLGTSAAPRSPSREDEEALDELLRQLGDEYSRLYTEDMSQERDAAGERIREVEAKIRAALSAGTPGAGDDALRWQFVRSRLSDGGTMYEPSKGRRHCSLRLVPNMGAYFPDDGTVISPEQIVDAAALSARPATETDR